MTDGLLLAELQADPFLREYDTLIVDEAHERSLNIDFILGHLRRLRARRLPIELFGHTPVRVRSTVGCRGAARRDDLRVVQGHARAAARSRTRRSWSLRGEELRVSLFAQELGTAAPVSAVRLERALEELKSGRTPAAPVPAARPLALPVTGKTVLKSLGALENFPR